MYPVSAISVNMLLINLTNADLKSSFFEDNNALNQRLQSPASNEILPFYSQRLPFHFFSKHFLAVDQHLKSKTNEKIIAD